MLREDFPPGAIIWSADVPKDDIVRVITAQALPKGTIIKLDRLFFEHESKDFIDFCQEAGYPVFCDAKIVEIPDKVIMIAETYLAHRPFMLNVMAGICSTLNFNLKADEKQRDALKRFADACAEVGTRSCAVTVLTSKSVETCVAEFDVPFPYFQVMKYVEMLNDAGITDIVCSPQEVYDIQMQYPWRFTINTPGVRLPDSSKDDQQRVMTPRDAFANEADRLVIGRDLLRGEGDIVSRIQANYQKILDNIFGE